MTDNTTKESIERGLWFFKMREMSGYKSQRQFADASLISNSTISKIESGKQTPRPNTLVKLAPYLNCSFEELMIKFGYLSSKYSNFSQSVMPVNAFEVSSTYSVPVLGRIPAGTPSLVYEAVEIYEDLPRKWLNGDPDNFFILHVEGDSMEGAKIFDGDLALIHKQPLFDNGQICAVGIIGESPELYATLKYVYHIDDAFLELVPANNKYPRKKVLKENVTILGLLKKTFRNH